MADKHRREALAAMAAQGNQVGYRKRPEVEDYPVPGCLGGVEEAHLETMAANPDEMGDDEERKRVIEALMDFDQVITATLAGLPSPNAHGLIDRERFPYLNEQIVPARSVATASG